jgi:glycerol-3-phosphate acyltransferase PlsY
MNIPFESVAVYLLGFVGLAAAGLLPYRSWLLMIDVFKTEVPQVRKRSLFVLAALTSAIALWCEIQVVGRVFACLTEPYCGPGVASGWGYLAMLGAVYIGFEAMNYLLRKVARRAIH